MQHSRLPTYNHRTDLFHSHVGASSIGAAVSKDPLWMHLHGETYHTPISSRDSLYGILSSQKALQLSIAFYQLGWPDDTLPYHYVQADWLSMWGYDPIMLPHTGS